MKYILAALFFVSTYSFAQVKEADKLLNKNLHTSINYLADDKLEGRRTGTPGEKLAYEYIEKEFKNAGFTTFTNNKSYLQPFDVNDGMQIKEGAYLTINKTALIINEDYFAFPFSGNAINLSISNKSTHDYDTYNLAKVRGENENNPHLDLYETVYDLAIKAQAAGRKALFICNTSYVLKDSIRPGEDLTFEVKNKKPRVTIPVIFITLKGITTFSQISNPNLPVTLNITLDEKHRTGHNVIGYINNNAPGTIILGAHYDHLGYGEDHNSLYAGNPPMIHNGADDNASGTAALIEIGKWLKKSSCKKYNYLLVSFSGEELGLFGSKYFTDHPGLDLKTVDYMINMDMVGRLNDSTHGLTIGGYGTSPAWGKLIHKNDTFFKINIDSSGTSDHTSFYRKDIPVLFFFTGSHKDYHKPSDDADKINYAGEIKVIRYIQNIILQTNEMDKISFTKTRETSMGRSTFKVSLGIMPDYTYNGAGVLVDAVSENRPAQKAGILTGDVLIQLGEHKFTDVQTYMDALNKFNKGENTNVKLKRGDKEMTLPISF